MIPSIKTSIDSRRNITLYIFRHQCCHSPTSSLMIQLTIISSFTMLFYLITHHSSIKTPVRFTYIHQLFIVKYKCRFYKRGLQKTLCTLSLVFPICQMLHHTLLFQPKQTLSFFICKIHIEPLNSNYFFRSSLSSCSSIRSSITSLISLN